MGKSELNIDKLLEELNIEEEKDKNLPMPIEELNDDEKRKELDSLGSTDDIIKSNILKLNKIFDVATSEIMRGNTSSRSIEAASKLADSITNAAKTLSEIEVQDVTLGLQTRHIEVKEKNYNLKEFEVKKKMEHYDTQPENVTNNNILITDRESLLKMLKMDAGVMTPLEKKRQEIEDDKKRDDEIDVDAILDIDFNKNIENEILNDNDDYRNKKDK